ncbi:hypothetical protein Ancab_015346 [Ancistrocladus abbreviatus]
MHGLPISASPAAAINVGGGAPAQTSMSEINSFRIGIVAERLAMCAFSTQRNDFTQFFNLCLSLARGIDFAVATNDIPARASDLPLVLKQVCRRRNEFILQAAIMVLMISVKSACKNGWFNSKDSEELLALSNEVASCFCTMGDMTVEPSSLVPTIAEIILRFYPQLKLGQILALSEIKPGYATCVVDFHISKKVSYSPGEKIRLFVGQKDNIETSSCIVNPPHVNFLINGKGVERRTNVMMDQGPQLPTIVNTMLKYGTNLLQAVGQSEGHYIVLVAFMSITPSTDLPVVQDYVQPTIAPLDSDSEIIEGPSRITLNCPISRTRIETPTKGHMCKHHQCFDLNNYVKINSRRPSWRCPHCNQSVCYTDIRIDRNMVKILQEVAEHVVDVIISADGCWRAASSSMDQKDEVHDGTMNPQQEGPEQRESSGFAPGLLDVCDLTDGDDEIVAIGPSEQEDCKPVVILDLGGQSVPVNPTVTSVSTNTSEVNWNPSTQLEGVNWTSGFLNSGLANYSTRPDRQIFSGISQAPSATLVSHPVLTDAVSPEPSRELEAIQGTGHVTNAMMLTQYPAINSLQSQQSQFGQSMMVNEYGRLPVIPGNVTRTPVAIQALPAQTPSLTPSQRPRTSVNPLGASGFSLPSQTPSFTASVGDGMSTIPNDLERQQLYSQSYVNALQVPDRSSALLQQPSATQHLGVPALTQLPSASYTVPSHPRTEHQQQPLHQSRLPQRMSQPPHLRSSYLGRSHVPPAVPTGGVSHMTTSSRLQLMAAAHRVAQMVRQSTKMPANTQTPAAAGSIPMNSEGLRATAAEQRGTTGGMVQSVSRAEQLIDLQSEQNWRPTGRMRGSLSGRAYSAALSQLMIQPTEPAQTPKPPSNLSVPPHLRAWLANAHASQNPNHPATSS